MKKWKVYVYLSPWKIFLCAINHRGYYCYYDDCAWTL